MNDDSKKSIEDRLQALVPQPLSLDAEELLASAASSGDEGNSPAKPAPLVTSYHQGVSLAAACVVGMIVGSLLTAYLMRPSANRSTTAQQNKPSEIDGGAMDRESPGIGVTEDNIENEPSSVGLATNRRDGVSRGGESLTSDGLTFNRNGLTYSLRQQRFLGTSSSMVSVDTSVNFDALPAVSNADESPRRARDQPLHRRDRLMQELLRM